MAASIRDWPRLVRQCYKYDHKKKKSPLLLRLLGLIIDFCSNLKPGGWVEFQDGNPDVYSDDDTLKPDENHVVQMLRLLSQACDKVGCTLDPMRSLKRWVQEAGFVNVDERIFKMPMGTWPKDERLVSYLPRFF